jgi:formylglycine-generating enzyme required for sulfatase activity
MNSSPPEDQQPRQGLIVRPSSGLIGLPEGRSGPLDEMIQRSLDHLTESAGLVDLDPRPGTERDFPIAPEVSIRMCWCPPGTFMMGSPTTEEDRCDNEDQIEVTLTKGYWMGKYQVTQAQWQAVMGTNPSFFKGANLPVESVSWHDAHEFLGKLNARLGSKDGGTMVLPTEAQWEYAARAGSTGVYSGGGLEQVAWYSGNSGPTTHAVGTKKANAWGLYDMSGNVWEWCQDWYGYELPGGGDPKGPASGTLRVLRGGSWGFIADCCRVAKRDLNNPTVSFKFIGFRVVRSSVP